MAYLIKFPAVAAGTAGGILHQWLKQEGDQVAVGDAIAEVESEKAIVEINAEHAGVLGRIVVQAGTGDVAVDSVIGVLLADGEDDGAMDAALADGEDDESAESALADGEDNESAEAVLAVQGTASDWVCAAAPAPAYDAGPDQRIFASPLARRLAAQWHVDLAIVKGSGPSGRVLRHDVEAARDRLPAKQADRLRISGRCVPHTGMRRAIARRLSESKQQVPHFYLSLDCRMDALMALRAQLNSGGTVKLSINDFIVRAAAQTLIDVPELNASWGDEAVQYHAGADISVAVSTEGGLVTPIVRDAAGKPLTAIATEIIDLAARAKLSRLRPEEYTGGSFTVSNLGMYGVREFAAIINPPQAAILAVGAVERRPIVAEDGSLEAASLMTVTLSVDHRAVDGAAAARWLSAFRERIQTPVRILL